MLAVQVLSDSALSQANAPALQGDGAACMGLRTALQSLPRAVLHVQPSPSPFSLFFNSCHCEL